MPRGPRPPSSCNWCFTLNNYTDEELKRIDTFHSSHTDTYIIYGKEVGDGTEDVPEGTPHLQGYVHLPQPRNMTYIKAFIQRAHIEKCKGKPEHNIAYCSKGGDVTVYGIQPKTQQQANKDKAARFVQLAEAGDFATIKEEMPGKYLQMYNTMHKIATDKMAKPDDLEDVCGYWLYGESGTGKTHSARNDYGEYFSKPCNKWWDGYQPEKHETVIIEDMDPNHSKLAYHLKLWTDKWSFTGEVKNGTRSLRPKRVIITSQHTIEEVFQQEGQAAVDAIRRRCKVINFNLPRTTLVPTLNSPMQVDEFLLPDPFDNNPEELHDYERVMISSAHNVDIQQ